MSKSPNTKTQETWFRQAQPPRCPNLRTSKLLDHLSANRPKPRTKQGKTASVGYLHSLISETRTMNRSSLLVCSSLFFIQVLFAQTVQLGGVVNTYHKVLAINTLCQTEVTLDTTGLVPGQKLLFYQAQGAEINITNSIAFGTVTSLGLAGRYEMATIAQALGSGKYLLNASLLTAWQLGAPGFQAVALPLITADARISAPVFAGPYQSATGLGGVLALDVPGTLQLDSNLIASGRGFRGGFGEANQSNQCTWLLETNDFSYEQGAWRAGNKGEGIAQFVFNYEGGRGPQANGGGGGNDHNTGGGGGGNSTRGARGGHNNEPSALGCDGTYEGEGGFAQNYPDRLFLGGGGGAGHGNNGPHAPGGNGGGLLILRAGRIAPTGGQILNTGTAGALGLGDGAGGGGAGGTTVLLVADQSGSAAIDYVAVGGVGGNTQNSNLNRCFGPGGGGAGGVLYTNIPSLNSLAQGGLPGRILGSTNTCNGNTGGAEPGTNGEKKTITELVENTMLILPPSIGVLPTDVTLCVGQTTNITAPASQVSIFQWQMLTGGIWQSLSFQDSIAGGQSSTLVLGAFTTPAMYRFRCIGYGAATCFAPDTSAELVVRVEPIPTAQFVASIMGTNVQFQNLSSGYSSLLWQFGDGASSTLTDPMHVYLPGPYTCTLTVFGPCDTTMITQDLLILLAPSANFTSTDSLLGCNSMTLSLQPDTVLAGYTYLWYTPGGSPSTSTNAVHTPVYAQSGEYDIRLIASNGVVQDTVIHRVVVVIENLPQAQINFTILGTSGTVVFENQSTGAQTWLWTFGDGTQSTSGDSLVTHTYINSGPYVVTLVATNGCGAAVTQVDILLDIVSTEEPSASRLKLYPNPASSRVFVQLPNGIPVGARLMLYDMFGRVVLSQQTVSGVHLLQLEGIAAGTYFLQVDRKFAAKLVVTKE